MYLRKFLIWSPIILFGAIVAGLLARQSGWLPGDSAMLTLTNRSDGAIEKIEVSIRHNPCRIARLEAGQSAACLLPIRHETHYTIDWTEAGSEAYREQAGYVTHGFDFVFELDFLGQGQIDFRLVESH